MNCLKCGKKINGNFCELLTHIVDEENSTKTFCSYACLVNWIISPPDAEQEKAREEAREELKCLT